MDRCENSLCNHCVANRTSRWREHPYHHAEGSQQPRQRGDTVTVEAVFTNTQADTAVAAGTLKYVLTGDILPEKVACTPVGATSGNISAGGALTVTYECTVDTDKIGSIAFKLDAKSEDNQYPEGLSNSVLIVPELSFQVTVDASAEDEIENIAYLNSTNFEPLPVNRPSQR